MAFKSFLAPRAWLALATVVVLAALPDLAR
jgi:hypothetical protein